MADEMTEAVLLAMLDAVDDDGDGELTDESRQQIASIAALQQSGKLDELNEKNVKTKSASVNKASPADVAVDAIRQLAGSHNLAKLTDVRPALARAGIGSKDAQDAALIAAWRSGKVGGQVFEGRHGSTQQDRDAFLKFNGENIGYFYVKSVAMGVHKALSKGQPTGEYDDDNRTITWVMTTETQDRDGETVNPEGGVFDDFLQNPAVQFNHDTDDFPIGKLVGEPWNDYVGEGTKYDSVGGPRRMALLGKVFFSKENPKGDLAYRMAKEGTLGGGSISFLPVGGANKNGQGGNHYDRWKLLEFTICPVGSNPDAIALMKMLKAVSKVVNVKAMLKKKGLRFESEQQNADDDFALVKFVDSDDADLAEKGLLGNGYDHERVDEKTLKVWFKDVSSSQETVSEKAAINYYGGAWWVTDDRGRELGPFSKQRAEQVAASPAKNKASGVTEYLANGVGPSKVVVENGVTTYSDVPEYCPVGQKPNMDFLRKAGWKPRKKPPQQQDVWGRPIVRSAAEQFVDDVSEKRLRKLLNRKGWFNVPIISNRAVFKSKAEAGLAALDLGDECNDTLDAQSLRVKACQCDNEIQFDKAPLAGHSVTEPWVDRHQLEPGVQVAARTMIPGKGGSPFARSGDKLIVMSGPPWIARNSEGDTAVVSIANVRRIKAMKKIRKLWTNSNKAWLLKSDGPVDDETQDYLEERGLDDVRIEEEPPKIVVEEESAPGTDEWVEEEMTEPEHQSVDKERDSSPRRWFDKGDYVSHTSGQWGGQVITWHGDANSPTYDVKDGRGQLRRVPQNELEAEMISRSKRKKSIDVEPSGPPGYRALCRMIKVMEDETRDVEKSEVLDSTARALKLLRAAKDRAYKDLTADEPQPLDDDEEQFKDAMTECAGENMGKGMEAEDAVDTAEVKAIKRGVDKALIAKVRPWVMKALRRVTKAFTQDEIGKLTEKITSWGKGYQTKQAMNDLAKVHQGTMTNEQFLQAYPALASVIGKSKGPGEDVNPDATVHADDPVPLTQTIIEQRLKDAFDDGDEDAVMRAANEMVDDEGADEDVMKRLKAKVLKGRKVAKKRLSKADKEDYLEIAKLLDDAADHSPYSVAEGLRARSEKIKRKAEDPVEPEPEVLSPEDEAMVNEAMKGLEDEMTATSKSLFRATGLSRTNGHVVTKNS